uniref:RING-type E3 ubiquitin transferase n=1 Tax=Oryza barthii TaxID=65489 RepID=A0A0D3GF17_9ORYZ
MDGGQSGGGVRAGAGVNGGGGGGGGGGRGDGGRKVNLFLCLSAAAASGEEGHGHGAEERPPWQSRRLAPAARTQGDLRLRLRWRRWRCGRTSRSRTPPHFPYAPRGGGSASASLSVECAICLERLRRGELCSELPECRHVFHRDCVALWIKSKSTCPLCRARISPWFSGSIGAPPPLADMV